MCFDVAPILACPVFHDHPTITIGDATALYLGRDGIQSAFDHIVAAVGLNLREGMIELRPNTPIWRIIQEATLDSPQLEGCYLSCWQLVERKGQQLHWQGREAKATLWPIGAQSTPTYADRGFTTLAVSDFDSM